MSKAFFILACISAVLSCILALGGCNEIMLEREPAKTKRQQAFRLFDSLILQGLFWSAQSFKKNWAMKPLGRKLLYWALGFLVAFLLFCGLTIYTEITKQ